MRALLHKSVTVLFLICGLIRGVTACGIPWEPPLCHFNGVDDSGKVLYTNSLGDVDVGDGISIPLTIMFKSSWHKDSPVLGYGWMMPLLESNFAQIDENHFQMRQPGGWFRNFVRLKDNPNILDGGSWKAEIKGDTIVAAADCGDTIVFKNGLINALHVSGKKLTFGYRDGVPSKITLADRTILEVLASGNSPDEIVVRLADLSEIKLKLKMRPVIQQLNGKNLVTAQRPSLSEIERSDGTKISFEFGIDKEARPFMTAPLGFSILWDPATELALSDANYQYLFQFNKKDQETTILRNSKDGGVKEFWKHSKRTGDKTWLDADSVQTELKQFSHGALIGLPRSLKTTNLVSGDSEILKYSYDENGLILRKTIENFQNGKLLAEKDTSFFRGENGEIKDIRVNGKSILTSN